MKQLIVLVMVTFSVIIQASDSVSRVEAKKQERQVLALRQADLCNPVLDSRYSDEQLKQLDSQSLEIAKKLQLAITASAESNMAQNKQQEKPFGYLRKKKSSLSLCKPGFHPVEQIKMAYTRVGRVDDYNRFARIIDHDSDVDSDEGKWVIPVFGNNFDNDACTEAYCSDVDSEEKSKVGLLTRKGFKAEIKNKEEIEEHDLDNPRIFIFQYLIEQPCPYKRQQQYMCSCMNRTLKKETPSKDAMAYSAYVLAWMRLPSELWGEAAVRKARSGLRLTIANLMQHPTLHYTCKYDPTYAQRTLAAKNIGILPRIIVKKPDNIEWVVVPSIVHSLQQSQLRIGDDVVANGTPTVRDAHAPFGNTSSSTDNQAKSQIEGANSSSAAVSWHNVSKRKEKEKSGKWCC